ncbi:MAG: LysR family transcriptional regulator [Rhodospirillaceae bacterium]|jgi:DNA-binding transcriptional LysR family regulator|nr:LysR family transcriptional regulator [Rhodospirillaceae bacterium]MBT5239332.1 LysR family transcriptional regulator [Rhodospirillaceae bacterium]MBT5566350.1 LysR family transcriptional regulator [Rhodospirillaceae bacterium]MBT6088443.1 LysR family transcriptional regulator [Rhodospirillaceae bacterium]MBT6961863.1 LysR family transcriptional regulator [Rhodospirillaceae bacterium]
MEFKQLRHFVAVVESGTLSGASLVLHITQPALTRSIKNLEAQLQAELFERGSRGVTPTEAGTRLYHQAKMILNETARTASDVTATAKGERGSLNVGVAAMFAGNPMADVLIRLRETVPDLAINVTEGFFEDLITDLKTAHVEALISNFPPGVADEGLIFEPLITVHSHFVVSAKHPLANKNDVSMADLQEHHLALVGQAHVSVLVADLFAAENLTLLKPAIETNSLVLLRSLVQSNGYVSLLPEHLLEQDVKDGRIVPLAMEGTPFKRSSGLILRGLETQRPAVKHFVDATRAVFADWPEVSA